MLFAFMVWACWCLLLFVGGEWSPNGFLAEIHTNHTLYQSRWHVAAQENAEGRWDAIFKNYESWQKLPAEEKSHPDIANFDEYVRTAMATSEKDNGHSDIHGLELGTNFIHF